MKNIFHFIKNNVKIIVVIIIVLSIFYWFEWRPMHIKSSCAAHALKVNSDDNGKTFDEGGFNATYLLCLHQHGL
jgi:predicted RND superfamily exporter protein